MPSSSTLKLADGSTRSLTLHQSGEALEVRERNGGLPDAWGQPWSPGAPILFQSWDADVLGYTTLIGGFIGVEDKGLGRFSIARNDQFKYWSRRNGLDIYGPGVGQHHAILPGDTLYMRFPPFEDPWELRLLAKITPAQSAKALEIVGFDEVRLAKWQWLRKVLGWYTYDASSLNPATPAGQRNQGFALNPWGFMARWQFQPNGLPAQAHWYGFGHKQAGQSLINEHYGHEAWWMARGLREGHAAAFTAGLYLLRWKIAYGLIWCDQPNLFRGQWRTEAGDVSRGTLTMVPSEAKAWDTGLAMASVLFPNDQFIQEAAQVRKSYVTSKANTWGGAGGARNFGRMLANLHDWYRATGDPTFKVKAEIEIGKTFAQYVGNDLFIREYPPKAGVTHVSAGEGMLALAYACRWVFDEGVRVDLIPKLQQMIGWYVTNGCRWTDSSNVQCGYYLDVGPAGVITQWGGDFQGAFWLQLKPYAGALQPTFDAIEKRMYQKYVNTPTCDVMYGGEGPGWEKWAGILVQSARK